MPSSRPTCLADGPPTADGHRTVCMRPDRHGGHCRFVADDEVVVVLTSAGRAALFRSHQVKLEVDHGR